MEFQQLEDRQRAWKSMRTIAFLISVVSCAAIASWYFAWRLTHWQWFMSLAFVGLCSAVFFRFRNLSSNIYGLIYLLVIGLGLFANSLTNYKMAEKGLRFDSFSGFKIVSIAVAILAPSPVWVGFSVVALCAVVPFILYFAIFSEQVRAVYSLQEPWITGIYAIVAAFVFRNRMSEIRLERTLSRLKAERRAVDDLARIFLGLRDLTNTPLQSIELTTCMIATGKLSPAEAAKHLENALIRLRELSKVLASYEKDVDWSSTTSSFNAGVMLTEKITEIQPHYTVE